MKRVILSILIVIATASSKDLSTFIEERLKLESDSQACAQSSQVEKHILLNLRRHHFSEDDKLKVYLFCILKSINWQKEDGSLNKQKIQDDLAKNITLTKAMKHCIDLIGGTGAETAYIFLKCYLDHVPEEFKRALSDDFH